MLAGSGPATGQPFYFGKHPLSGDFIQSGDSRSVQAELDHWIASALLHTPGAASMAAATGFCLCRMAAGTATAGVIQPSTDSLGRIYPWVMGRTSGQLSSAGHFARLAGIYAGDLWQRLMQYPPAAVTCLTGLENLCQQALSGRPVLDRADYARFLQDNDALDSSDQLARMALALGLLLRPVLDQGTAGLKKALFFHFPASPEIPFCTQHLFQIAFLQDLVYSFVRRFPADLLLLAHCRDGRVRVSISFDGLNSQMLAAFLVPATNPEVTVDMSNISWLDAMLAEDIRLQDALNHLSQADDHEEFRSIFQHLFTGEVEHAI